MRFAGSLFLVVLPLACAGELALEPPAIPRPAALAAVTATTFTGVVGTMMDPAPTVRATDLNGNPVRGVWVTFSMTAEGGVVWPAAVIPTNGDGIATVAMALGERVGLHFVAAQVPGLPGVTFAVTAAPGHAASMTPVLATQGQYAVAGTALALPLSLVLADRFGNLLAGVEVTFSVLSGGGSIDGAAAITDSSGVASSGKWTLGAAPGQQQASAQAEDLTVVFTASALAEPCESCTTTAQLAFVRDHNIYVSRLNGSDAVALTSTGVNADPAWSPDGRRIAFSSDRGGRTDIYVMNADGSGLVRRTDTGGYNSGPAWSPDGRKLAFSSVRGGQFGIYVMSVDGDWANPVQIGPDRGWNADPAWSPDGGKIAFTSDMRAYDIVYDLYTMNSDGSNVTAVLQGPLLAVDGPIEYYQAAWSPDGKTIAVAACPFAWDSCHPTSTVTLVNADGSNRRVLVDAGGPASPAWSPDGKVIAFSSTTCRGCASVIRFVTADGAGIGLPITNAQSPAWRP